MTVADLDDAHHHTNLSPAYHLLMLVLSLFAIAALGVEVAMRLKPEVRAVLDYADYGVCVLFAGDFVVSLYRAPDRRRYFFRWGWLDLLSSIPVLSVARWGRIARIARVFRVLRGVRATREITAVILKERARNTFSPRACLPLCSSSCAASRFCISKQRATQTFAPPKTRCGGPSRRSRPSATAIAIP